MRTDHYEECVGGYDNIGSVAVLEVVQHRKEDTNGQ